MQRFCPIPAAVVLCALGCAAGRAADPDPAAVELFERRVRPLLIERCQDCHSRDSAESDLSLDSLAGLLHGGLRGPAIVPGKPDESLLIRAIRHGELLKMPPKKKLKASEIADVARWIEMGAPWPNSKPAAESSRAAPGAEPAWSNAQRSFWAFQRPVAVGLPEAIAGDDPPTPVDRFIVRQIRDAGVEPASPADSRTIVRRVYFDLIGLPPSPDAVERYVASDAPDVLEREIDRLLASPHYGQHWGRHWLDVARFADSNGLDENLAYANAFRYRDYVVRAFNRDLPYDQFVREQIAGDLLPDSPMASDRFDRLTATGFLCLGAKMLAEDDPVKMQMDIIDEQIDTLGRAFMGMTFGCARCHDHKFDPLSMHDYYGLAGIFKSTKTMENFSVVARWQERPLATPDAIAASDQVQQQIDAKKAQIATLVDSANNAVLTEARRHVGDYLIAAIESQRMETALAGARPYGDSPDASKQPGVQIIEAESFVRGNLLKDFDNYGAGIGVALNGGAPQGNFAEYDLEFEQAGLKQIEIRYAAADSRPCRLFVNGKQVKTDAAAQVTGGWFPGNQKWEIVGFYPFRAGKNVVRLEHITLCPHIDKILFGPAPESASAHALSRPDKAYEPIASFVTQWKDRLKQLPSDEHPLWAELRTALASDNSDAIAAAVQTVQQRVAVVMDAWEKLQESSTESPAGLSNTEDESIRRLVYREDGPFRLPTGIESHYAEGPRQQLESLRKEQAGLQKSLPAFPQTMAVSDQTAEDVRIHIRGSHLTQSAVVPRRMPVVLTSTQPTIAGGSSGRLALANWLATDDHPLTARVMVNRIWQWHFGDGLVRSPDNFGSLGEPPTHPELLDWLAVEFPRRGWSVKSLHRLLLSTAVWNRRCANPTLLPESDPDNRLWSHANRRRLQAEAIRDSLLAVAGALDESIGGSKLPTPNRAYVTSTANVDPVAYKSDRKSIYLPVVRSAVYDVFQAFDFSDPSVLNGKRQSTTVAPQALFMMNSKFVSQQSRRMAERLLREEPFDDATRIRLAWQTAYGRTPTESEIVGSLEFVASYEQRLRESQPAADNTRLLTWKSLCRAILAANEFLFVE